MRRVSLAKWLAGSIFCIWLDAWSVGAQPAPPTDDILIPAGAEVMVLTKTDLSSNTALVGERLAFEVARDVIVNGLVVIAKGAPVEAVVTLATPRKSFGRGGKLGISVETVTAVDGQKIKLRATLKEQGEGRKGTMAILTILGGPLGGVLFGEELKGSNARLKAGTEIKAETTEEKTVSVAPLQPPAQDRDKILKAPLLR